MTCTKDSHFWWIGNLYCACGEKRCIALLPPKGRSAIPKHSAVMNAVNAALNNAVENGHGNELARMSDRAIAENLARFDAGLEDVEVELLVQGVQWWRGPAHVA